MNFTLISVVPKGNSQVHLNKLLWLEVIQYSSRIEFHELKFPKEFHWKKMSETFPRKPKYFQHI